MMYWILNRANLLIMLRVTAIRSGVDYLLHGCASHEAESARQGMAAAGPEAGHAPSAENYYLKGTAPETPAVWFGDGLGNLGMAPGSVVTERDARALLGDLCDPRIHGPIMDQAEQKITDEGLTDRAAQAVRAEARATAIQEGRLGSAPRNYKTSEERIEARIADRGGSDRIDPEERSRIAAEENKKPKGDVLYRDFTFSPSKSTSVLYAGFKAAGRHEDAQKLLDSHKAGVRAGMDYLQKEGGFARAGHHGKSPDGKPSTGRWVDGHGFLAADFVHLTNREGEVQIHSHAAVSARVLTKDKDGTEKWRALDGPSLTKLTKAASAIYERTQEAQAERDLAVRYETREDGKAREIMGITQEDRDAHSTRRTQVTEKRDQLAEAYRQKYGREPSQYTLTIMSEKAALATRKGKEQDVTPEKLLERWERITQERVGTSLASIVERAEAAGVEARVAELLSPVEPVDRGAVIDQALTAVQTRQATWTRSDLIRELNRALPDGWKSTDLGLDLGTNAGGDAVGQITPVLDSLADEALSGQFGTVQVGGHELISPPEELRRESDGRSVYRPGRDEVYATEKHMTTEERIIGQATATGAPALEPSLIAAAIERNGLSDDQAAAVRGALSDGRGASVIVGPAGAGKTTAQRTTVQAWNAGGGRVIALAPSSVAAHVIGSETGAQSMNTPLWLATIEGNPGSEWAPRAGDLLILDEAGMASTHQVKEVLDRAETAGAKVILAGDWAQLGSPEAGGIFKELTNHGAYELDTVRRFKDANGDVREWEAKASLGMRRGDASVLAEYERHGRLHGGTREDMIKGIVDHYTADVLADRDSVVSAPANEDAAELSMAIRERLVEEHKVEPGGVQLSGDTIAGVGDRVQTRQNDYSLIDSAGMPVYNRFVYEVTGRGEDGSLDVQRITGRDEEGQVTYGGEVTLPAEYVATDVDLAYAGTGNAVQGVTVTGGSYGLFTEQSSREDAYVPLTRSTTENHAFVVTVREPDAHNPEGLASDPVSVMTRVLENDRVEEAAIAALREDLDWSGSSGALGPIYADVTGEWQQQRYDDLLTQLLPPETYQRMREEGPDTVYRQLQNAEMRGHDVEALLTQTTRRQMMDADSVPGLLYWRNERALEGREPEREPATSWRDRVPESMTGSRGEFAREVGAALDAREVVLGERQAEAPEPWALDRLGPVPQEDPLAREEWMQRAGTVAAYREAYVDAPGTTIGPMPQAGAVYQRAAWDEAFQALGTSDEERQIATADDDALRRMVDTYEDEKKWAPAWMRDEQRDANQGRDHYDVQARLADAKAGRAADGESAEQQRVRAEAYRELSGALGERATAYGEITEARDAWYQETQPARETADAARSELSRRGIDYDEERKSLRERVGDGFSNAWSRWFKGESPEPEWHQPGLFDLSQEQRDQQQDLQREHDQEQADPEAADAVDELQPEASAELDPVEAAAPVEVDASLEEADEVEQVEAPAVDAAPVAEAAPAEPEQPALFELTDEQLEAQRILQEQFEQQELTEDEPEAEVEPEAQQPAPAEPGAAARVSPMIADLTGELERAREAVGVIGSRREVEEEESLDLDLDIEEQRGEDLGIDEEQEQGPERSREDDEAPELSLELGR